MKLVGLLLGSINCAEGAGRKRWARFIDHDAEAKAVECKRYKLFAKAVFEAGFPAKMVLGIPPHMEMSTKVAEMSVRQGCREMCDGRCDFKQTDLFSEALCYEYDPGAFQGLLEGDDDMQQIYHEMMQMYPEPAWGSENAWVSAAVDEWPTNYGPTNGSYDHGSQHWNSTHSAEEYNFHPFWWMYSMSDDVGMFDWFYESEGSWSYDPAYYGWEYDWDHYSYESIDWDDIYSGWNSYNWSTWDSSYHSWGSFDIYDIYLPEELEHWVSDWHESSWWKPEPYFGPTMMPTMSSNAPPGTV